MKPCLLVAFCLAGLWQSAWAQDRLSFRGLVEAQAFYNSADQSWLDGGFSKTRFDESTFPLQLGKVGLHVDYHLTDTLWLRTLSTYYLDDGLDAELIETYFVYRPAPQGPLRWRAKLGAFHLPLSLENTGVAWSSRFGITPSVINSWIGEDLRTIGAEVSLEWPGRFRQSEHSWKLIGAVFGYNDASGTVLNYRGWAAHDRQTGLFSPLREPTLVPGVKREVFPFYENDDRPGYYLSGAWTWQDRFELQLFHYDNLAETGHARGGQIGWRTWFQQVSAEWRLPHGWLLAAQAMRGNTRAVAPVVLSVCDSDFESVYFLINKEFDQHSFSARVEGFAVDDEDQTPSNMGEESGRSLMLSWQYAYSPRWRVGAEWLLLDSEREERRIVTGDGDELIHQLLFNVQYRFQN
ncbi:MAG: hypothetical protein EPO31_07085 [Gammaproteobacteria bacterium]|nr:MAG: hypothetical protein EPO31_07085 [Gammaproteobacteria bacterium]